MQLVSATEDLAIGGLPYPGFPILLWDSMDSCVPVNHFFRHYLLRGAIGSVKSWAPTGRALYDYFSFLQAHALSWEDVDRGEAKTLLAAYRDYCFRVAKLARSTVRQRLLYICEFYEFAHRQEWIGRLPYSQEARRSRRSRGMLGHLHRGDHVSTRDVMPRAHLGLPRFLSAAQIKGLLAAATNPHHRMIIRLALGSGLRKEELATFPLAYVVNPDRLTNSRNIRIDLDPFDGQGIKTKGSRERVIFVSRRLMRDLHQYAVHYRGERASLNNSAQRPLFLNQDGQLYSADGKSLDRIVRLIGQKAGLKVWTHMLRHTYATHTLVALQRNRAGNRLEPLVFLQKQLGHASPQSTLIYLHLIQELADDAVLTYDGELEDLARSADGQA
ncbi:MAG: site-specific integrase [Pseudomonadota bacterium]